MHPPGFHHLALLRLKFWKFLPETLARQLSHGNTRKSSPQNLLQKSREETATKRTRNLEAWTMVQIFFYFVWLAKNHSICCKVSCTVNQNVLKKNKKSTRTFPTNPRLAQGRMEIFFVCQVSWLQSGGPVGWCYSPTKITAGTGKPHPFKRNVIFPTSLFWIPC